MPNKNPSYSQVRRQKSIVTDADGTLWSFWYYFCPFIRTAIPWLSDVFQASQSDVALELGRIFERFGTHEPLEPLVFTSFRRNWRHGDRSFYQICDEYNRLFDQHRADYLVLFPSVRETLRELPSKASILSDSPLPMLVRKAHELGVLDLFKGAVAMSPEIPQPEEFFEPADRQRLTKRLYELLDFEMPYEFIFGLVPKEHQKPNIQGMRKIRQLCRTANLIMVGDNLAKDGGVAFNTGIPFLYTPYGLNLPPEYIRLVNNLNEGYRSDGHGIILPPEAVRPPIAAALVDYSGVLSHI